ncbi:MAG: hypothetical protein ACI8RD_010095 [Bacillariaceae sp.]|jgi:hypothetical protein
MNEYIKLRTWPNSLSFNRIGILSFFNINININNITGLGLCSGIVLVTGTQWAKKLGFIKGGGLNKNTAMLTVLSSFAFGTFFAASTTGKELAHLLHPMFQAASLSSLSSSSSSEDNNNNNNNNINDNSLGIRHNNNNNVDDTRRVDYQTKILMGSSNNSDNVDRQKLRELRLLRRKSLTESLHQRGHGLSDSHSGRWVEENSETKFEKE